MKNLKDEELQALLADVATEIGAMVKSEKQLSKAHPGEEDSSEVPADQSATSAPPAAASASPPASADSAPPSDGPPAASASPPGDASAPAPDADGDGDGDPAADAGADPAALEAEYSKLPIEDLKAHYLACKSALFAQMGAAQDPGAAPAPDAASAPPPAAPPAASAPPTLKGEMKGEKVAANGGPAVAMGKSEKDLRIAELETQLEKSTKGIDGLLDVVGRLIETPRRLAVTSVAHIARPGTDPAPAGDVVSLSKSEIKSRISRALPTMSKSDRDLVCQYDCGSIDVTKIAHLLKQ